MASFTGVYDLTMFMVSWEDAGSTVKEHSVTANTHDSFFMWPQFEYNIHVKVVNGYIASQRYSYILKFNSIEFFNVWKNNQTI